MRSCRSNDASALRIRCRGASTAVAARLLGVSRHAYQAFGLCLLTDLALPGRWRTTDAASDRVLEIAWDSSVPQVLPAASPIWAARIDGGVFTVERDGDGAVLFRHESGRHLLSPDGHFLACAPAADQRPAWFRVLLDPVLTCVALLGGREGLHAGCVMVGEDAVAITAGSGGGKSTLVAELVRRGHALVADDITMLEVTAEGRPRALPGPPVMTLPDACDHPSRGEVLMELPGERWVAVAVSDTPAPLRTIVQLERRGGAPTGIDACRDALTVLLGGGLLKLPRTPERAVARLDLASTLATRCEILTLTADPLTTPGELAELVEQAVLAA